MQPPEVRYARGPEGMVAYQVLGDGPVDLVVRGGGNDHLDLIWEQPAYERYLRRLASFSRLILFNIRGAGLSDPLPANTPAAEDALHDVRVVLDEVGSERAALLGIEQGGYVAWAAAAYPDRISSLVLLDAFPRLLRAPDYPAGIPEDAFERFLEATVSMVGTGDHIDQIAPDQADNASLRRWYGRLERSSWTPAQYEHAWRWVVSKLDYRGILPQIKVPTLVISHSQHPYIRPGHGRYLAEHIPHARYVERPAFSGIFWLHDTDAVIDEIASFVSAEQRTAPTDRVLSTVLFTDVVASTEHAASLGDARWREILDAHDAAGRSQVELFRGRFVKSTGDGILATFDGPARAIRCGLAMRDALRLLGVELRAGVHTGEIELRGDDVGGLAVHIGARVMAAAGPGEVLASSTVRDLAAGSDLRFEDRGRHALKGLPDDWHLFALAD